MTSMGIRELKDNLSHYVRRTEAGERIAVTAHGRIVAELGPPTSVGTGQGRSARYENLIAAGVARPAQAGDPLADWPDLRLPKGKAAHLLDSDRGDA